MCWRVGQSDGNCVARSCWVVLLRVESRFAGRFSNARKSEPGLVKKPVRELR